MNDHDEYFPISRKQDLTTAHTNELNILRHFPELKDLIDPFGYYEDFWGDTEVSQPNDASEVQAESVANAVMNNDTSTSQDLMKMPVSESNSDAKLKTPAGFDEKLEGQKGGGVPLEEAQQEKLEKHLDTDLSDVRIHTGAEAQELATQVNARAFTKGKDIFFGEDVNEELLAHELTHAVNHAEGKVHRAMKFEFQTGNYVWKDNSSGSSKLMDRKFGEYGPTENGDIPAYLTTGDYGVKASKKGDIEYEEVKGDIATVKAEAHYTKFIPAIGIDESKGAQFVIKKLLKDRTNFDLGKMPKEEDTETIAVLDKKSDPIRFPNGSYNEDIYEFIYYEKYDPNPIGPYELGANTPTPFYEYKKGIRTNNIIRFMIKKEIKKDVDDNLPAQFVNIYRFTLAVDVSTLIDKTVVDGQLEFISQINNADLLASSAYNPNTFEFRYFNTGETDFSDDKLLPIHISPNGEYKNGHVKWMKVGRKKSKKMDGDKEAQYIEIWKVTEYANGDVSYFDPVSKKMLLVKLENITALGVDHSDDVKYPDVAYNPSTYEKKYYWDNSFGGNTLTNNPLQLNVHLSDGQLKSGHVKFMTQKISKGKEATLANGSVVEVGKEQTAMELQSENDGFIEFETPKWFRKWSDIKLRIQDAINMIDKINKAPLLASDDPARKSIQAKIDKSNAGKKLEDQRSMGELREWPFSIDHLPLNGERLIVEIVNKRWSAKIQPSEEVELSQYKDILHEHEENDVFALTDKNGTALLDKALEYAASATTLKTHPELKNIKREELKNLEAFLLMIANYLLRGQKSSTKGDPSKFAFRLLLRTSFYSIYHTLLSPNEQFLFNHLVYTNKFISVMKNDLKKLAEGHYKQADLDQYKKSAKKDYVNITGSSPVFHLGYGSHKHEVGPTINEWLTSIIKGGGYDNKEKNRKTDRLSPTTGGSASAGRFDVENRPGHSNSNLISFEIRGSINRDNNVQPMSNWISFAEDIFKTAATSRNRNDIPDDPTTPNVNESTSTGLIYDP
ncbi:MAG: DUF4157 domain-containing protein [Bacteroidia bacterium]